MSDHLERAATENGELHHRPEEFAWPIPAELSNILVRWAPPNATPFEQRLWERLQTHWREFVPEDALPDDLEAADDIAERMLEAVPIANPFNAAIGPFYDGPALVKWLGVQKQRLTTLRSQNRLLGINTSSNSGRSRVLYPSFQFGPKGQLLPHLAEVKDVLDPAMPNELTVARWLNTKSSLFGGTTAAKLLRKENTEPVLAAARHDAASLTR